jgi:hypothetical protein
MGNFDGQVLPGARASTSNADTTGEVSSGVSRAVVTSTTPEYPTATVTDLNGARYRATLLESGSTSEYLLWAHTTGPLVVVPGTTSTDGTVTIPTGTTTIGAWPTIYEDGTERLILTDNGGANILSLTSVWYRAGGSLTPSLLTSPGDFTFDSTSGVITLTTIVASKSRGDSFYDPTYTVGPATFNWTRNDPGATRFGWNGAHRKWEPYKGGAVKNLGRLSSSATQRYVLSPVPTVTVGSTLPGDLGAQYAMLRLGSVPDESGTPVVPDGDFNGVRVVNDDLANASYDFSTTSPPFAGVMGKNSGTVVWNPDFVAQYEGEFVWYSPRDFKASSKGVVGSILDDIYLAPVPSPVERPILRIGNRAPLTVLLATDETDLNSLTVNPGEVGVALTTGKVKLNTADVAKANPSDSAFDPLYLGATLHYDGLALNRYPQPVQAPVEVPWPYIPLGEGLPGTGVSGLLEVPDGTGNDPDPALPVSPRPQTSGLVKRLTPGFGDAFLLTRKGRIPKIVAVKYDSDLPTDIYSMPFDTAYVSLDTGLVRLGYSLLQSILGENVYFAQAILTPSQYPDGARVFSRIRDTFTFAGTESFIFSVDGTTFTYAPAAGTNVPAATVAAALNTLMGAGGTAGVINGYLYLAATTSSGSVSIGFDEDGCRVMGFPPGWYVKDPSSGDHSATDQNWLPDTGLAFGLSRSPNNLDGSQSAPDVRSTYRVEDVTLSEGLVSTPYQLLDYPPREDIAGYEEGQFFALSGVASPTTVQLRTVLQPWKDVVYEFDQSRFGWLSPFSFAGQVQSPVSSIDLGNAGVVPDTFYPPNLPQWTGGSLKVSSKGGAAQDLTFGTDFLVPEGSGTALLITRIGPEVLKGYRGSVSGSTLTDTSVDLTSIAQVGDRLKVTSGDSIGSYIVASFTATSLTVTHPFPVASTGNVSWELYRGVDYTDPAKVDPSVLADAVYNDFNHLGDEPFQVRLLTSLGKAGGTLDTVDLPTANSGRVLTARFGTTGLTTAQLVILTNADLGTIANGSLFVPNTGARFTTNKFSLVVGTKVFVNGVDLLPVSSFTPDPFTGSTIEYLTTTGELKFGSTVLADYQSASVVYREEVLNPTDINPGEGELSPFTGELGLNATDLTANTGKTVYLVDLQTYEQVYLNPIIGSFTFRRPMKAGQLVEATYTRAKEDSGLPYPNEANPTVVTEFLPVFIRREKATRINQQDYSFNSAGRTLDTDVSPSVFVNANLVSYGVPVGVHFNFAQNTFSLVKPALDPFTRVFITYAVYEAAGGETTYTVSSPPVWRPPFQLKAKTTDFTLKGERDTEFYPGQILRLGNYLTYIKSATYDSTSDTTTVFFYPSPTRDVGSLAPSDPPINLLTDRPITPLVEGTATSAENGLLPKLTDAYGLASIPAFQAVTRGDSVIRFDGDLTRYAVTGHVIELFGRPFLIAKSELIKGQYTDITLGTPAPVEMLWTPTLNTGSVRITPRPLYPVEATVFIGAGAFVPTEPYEVVLYEGTAPGVTLVEGRDYQLDPTAGTLALLQPRQAGLPAGASLRFYRTAQNSLAPFLSQGFVQYPRVSANAGFIDPPSETNGRLGAVLTATYTFDSPDSFYARSLPLQTYITETSRSIVQGVTRNASGTNPSVGTFAKNSSATQGTAGLISQRQDLVSRDRVTRTFLRYYNGVITSFEQVLENIAGNPVGDRDGKFRMWMGTGDKWTPPGYEDGITGAINPRNIWNEVWNGFRTSPLALLDSDPIVNPYSATLTGGVLTGNGLSAAALGKLQGFQYQHIKNDVDDVVLVKNTGTTIALTGFIQFSTTSYGVYQNLSEPSVYSRIFPERTFAFTTTDPGIGYDPASGNNGVYSFGKLELDLFGDPPSISVQSTNGKPIARLENPVRGNITSVLGAVVQDRRARARIVAYYPNGVSGVLGAAGRPVFLATVLPLDQFPLLPDGTPDTAKLASVSANTSDLPDLNTGDPSLHTPPFGMGQQLALGTPDGTTYGLGCAVFPFPLPAPFSGNVYTGVFVESVIDGCYVTVKTFDLAGADFSITDPTLLIRLTTPTTGTTLAANLGDTLYVVPPTGKNIPAVSDPPTTEQLGTYAAALPGYRMGTDVNLDGRGGQLVDATLPSWSDPFILGIKEITGQNPPPPVTNLQAQVTFQNGDTSPSNIPALRGQSRLDSGDYSLPYYQIGPTELEVLGRTFPTGIAVIGAQSPDPVADNPPAPGYPTYTVEAVYPDEILDNGGSVSPMHPTYPATLKGTKVLNPTYLPHTGVGTVQPYDLVYVQEGTGGTLAAGATGIRTVGAVDYASSVIEPPRFISQSNLFGKKSLKVENIQAWMDATHTTGIEVVEDRTVVGVVTTTFELIGVPTTEIVFNDGGVATAPPVGGFNTYFTLGDKPNLFRLKIISKTTKNFNPVANVLLELTSQNPNITLCSFSVSGDGGITSVGGSAKWEQQKLIVTTPTPFFKFAAYGVTTTPPITTMGLYDFAIDVDSGTLSSGGTQSMFIASDRLTLVGPIDTRTARPRGTTTQGGDVIECRLNTRGEECLLLDSTFGLVTPFSSLNSTEFVNDKEAFTFLPRSYIPSTYQVGAFGFGIGLLKVMAYEGWQNTELTSTDPITYSAAPSSRQDETAAILTTATVSDRVDNPPYTSGFTFKPRLENRFVLDPGAVLKGSMSSVLPGDIVVAQALSLDPAFFAPIGTTKAGTHLVRAVMVPTTGLVETRETLHVPDTNGDYHGWLDFDFPTLTGKNLGSLILGVSNIQALPPLAGWLDAPVTFTHVFPATGRVFVIVDEAGLNSTDAATFAASIASAAYTSFNAGTGKFSITTGTAKDGAGAALTDAQFFNLITVGSKVSGFYVLPLNPSSDIIPANLPGYTEDTGTQAVFGVRTLRISRPSSAPAVFTWNATGGALVPTVANPNLDVYQKVIVSSAVFQPLTEPVYNEIPGAIEVAMSDASWDTLHLPSGGAFPVAGARCFLPGDRWEVDYSGAAGIYVEPSFPRTANNMASGAVNVVDAANGGIPVGTRRLKDYITTPALGTFQLEFTEIEVRRPRRFHALGNEFAEALQTLRYSYEIRRGIVDSVVTSGGYSILTALPVNGDVPPTVTGGTHTTQLGDFTNALVNIHPGDEVRFINTSGDVYARAEVVTITGALTLKLSRKVTVTPGDRFEVYLKVPPVPHEQSNEELLGYATDTVLVNRPVNYGLQTGGKVSTLNVLTDTGVDFTAANVKKGDILLVDPAGLLEGSSGPAVPQQRGRRPYGDDSVPARGAPTYTAGSPVVADDNRGYYKVSADPTATTLTVQAIGNLAGNVGGDVVFGPAGSEYAIYPTIHGSLGSGGANEGQMDLRVTAPANGSNKFTGYASIEPFAYRVIRPTKLLTTETVELILAMRERMLSWMEEIRTVQFKYGTYFIFQRDRHISDLGTTTDPESGLGLLTNPYLFGLVGNWAESPFANVRDCLSILDRRYWCLDYRLDTLTPPYGISVVPYADFANDGGRPVEPDRINEALDGRDKLRVTRYSWLNLRVNRISGTLENIRRFDAELPKRRAEAEQALLAVQSIEKV